MDCGLDCTPARRLSPALSFASLKHPRKKGPSNARAGARTYAYGKDYSDVMMSLIENDAVLPGSKGCCFVCPGVKETMGTKHFQAILRLWSNII